jgi:NAD dependent epimerase/dehydratase family enzyme
MGGEMAREILLASQRVRPAALERAGFRFLRPGLEDALRFELGLLAS